MNGHIVRKERNGKVRYYPVVELDADPGTRKRQRKYHGGFERKKDAQAALHEILHRRSEGTFIEPSKQTVAQYLAEWLAAIRSTVRYSTLESYESYCRAYIVPAIGAVSLRSLDAGHLNQLYAELLEGGRRDGKGGLSPRSVRYLHVILQRALKDATRWGKVVRNVAELADPPRAKAPEGFTVWSPANVRTFLESVRDDRLYCLYLMALTTGMRRGELLGLRWTDVDLEKSQLLIRQTVISVGYKVQFSEPKTPRSRRMIALDPASVAALKAHRTSQLEERLAWGPAWEDTGLVFTRENGSVVHPQSASDAFERASKKAGLPRLRFHDLRHSYATLALEAGMKPWDLSDRLGHSSVAFTLQAYRHAVQATQESAATVAASFILGSI